MPNRRGQRARRIRPLKLPGFQKLPNEVILEVMKLAPQNVHAALLCTCKSFYSLGLKSLYRSIWITTPEGVFDLACTLESSADLASLVRSFKLIFHPHVLRPSHVNRKLDEILSAIHNAEEIQLFLDSAQPVHLPALRSYRGPMSIFKSLTSGVPSLTSLILDISHDDPEYILTQLGQLSHLEKRWLNTEERTKSGLSVELLVSLADGPFNQLLKTAIMHMPSDLLELNVCCTVSRTSESGANRENGMGEVALENFPDLRSFGMRLAMYSFNKQISIDKEITNFPELAPKAAKTIGDDCRSLQKITLCGRVYLRSTENAEEWIEVGTEQAV
ncbi:hypothetical protein K435DRAFT_490942 [Dendrothele bispora CBS 962.96]|uniref:F-box domain-containing protein n=1 Tax=Dendrothele bispora (strain CBS 962.96) TaxID=1314807 RepID=A0A4S8MAU5_DENBC|nr:hypothetical protein K435DRAFT_490942 [Dendrothele bispora CBS 962.96]